MTKGEFVSAYLELAEEVGKTFNINPVVILAQAALESGWGESRLAKEYHNFFGITAYGKSNEYWHGGKVELSKHGLPFRRYAEPLLSFMDYGRLLRQRYSLAADMSPNTEAFAKEIAYSPYISEVNGDNRESYRKALVKISAEILKVKGEM